MLETNLLNLKKLSTFVSYFCRFYLFKPSAIKTICFVSISFISHSDNSIGKY